MSDQESDIIQASLFEGSDTIIPFLYEKYPDLQKLFGECSTLQDLYSYVYNFLQNRYIAVKGYVQSGKTNFMMYSSLMFLTLGMDVVIVLRNSNSDLYQIYSRFDSFRKELEGLFHFDLSSTKKPKQSPQPQILLSLANGIALEKVLATITRNYVLFIDEADHVDSGTQTRKSVVLPMLKSQAHCVIGISATVMDLLGKEALIPKDLILLQPPSSYRGIPELLENSQYIPPGSVYSSKIDSNLLENDPYLLDWIQDLIDTESYKIEDGSTHPIIALISICDTVDPCVRARQAIVSRFGKKVVVIDHHADGILIQKGMIEDESDLHISDVLQELKDDRETSPIVIFAGDIAGRGVSYVSRDYGWHLTHQRLIVSKSCPEPELMQKVRLCGVYRDNIPLKLVSSEDILKDLRKAYLKQEELIEKVRGVANTFSGQCKEFFKEVLFEKEKMSGRQITKDPKAKLEIQLVDFAVGWRYEDVGMKEIIPEDYPSKEFDRLVNKMFPKWDKEDGTTNISRFMHELEPQKEYTHKEIIELCESTGISKKNLKNLTLVSSGKSNGYGMILEIVNSRYKLYSCLLPSYDIWFSAR